MFLFRATILLLIVCAILYLTGPRCSAQQKPPPQDPVRTTSALLLYPSGPTRVVETFAVIQQANQGIPSAQHELGYRYLVGRGVPPDSAKGAQWILKAARNGMALAQFNAGILYTHAIGVPWDPFNAYSWFKSASDQKLPSAQFIFGIMHVNGLVVRQNYALAYALVHDAFVQGYEEAKDVLEEFRRRGFDTLSVGTPMSMPETDDSTTNFVMLNFEDVRDPSVSDTVLLRELEREVGEGIVDSSVIIGPQHEAQPDTVLLHLEGEAERGIPEAHMVLGRMFEKGIGVKADPITAAVHYLRANRLDSPRAPASLVHLIGQDTFRAELLKRAQLGNEDARFVWAALSALDLDNIIGWEQALRFLQEQSEAPDAHLHSCLELGFWYASGRHVTQDPERAVTLWMRADSLGSTEGRTRAELARLVLGRSDVAERTAYFRKEAENGSILAQSGYAYCLRMGIGTAPDKPEAAAWYEKAARRGSLSAYYGLKGMYDELRPADEEFRIE